MGHRLAHFSYIRSPEKVRDGMHVPWLGRTSQLPRGGGWSVEYVHIGIQARGAAHTSSHALAHAYTRTYHNQL